LEALDLENLATARPPSPSAI